MLAEFDFVTLHVNLTPQTYHMIDREALRQMKPTAILVNAARGGCVDPDALVEALRSGEIAYAALDVTEPEPLPADHPLVHLPNCIIVPHIASASIATRTKMATMAADNLLAGVRGEPLPTCVNPEVIPGLTLPGLRRTARLTSSMRWLVKIVNPMVGSRITQ